MVAGKVEGDDPERIVALLRGSDYRVRSGSASTS
jgi:hypothetical protein